MLPGRDSTPEIVFFLVVSSLAVILNNGTVTVSLAGDFKSSGVRAQSWLLHCPATIVLADSKRISV